MLSSCHHKVHNPNGELTLDAFDTLRVKGYRIVGSRVRNALDSMVRNDSDTTLVDRRVKGYYMRRKPMVWLTRRGVDHRADTLLAHLSEVGQIGFNPERFRLRQIESDLKRMRTLDFDKANRIDRVVARLEYNLTKAYMRYATGQRFGFSYPWTLLNNLDRRDGKPDAPFCTLYDLKTERPGKDFFYMALGKVKADSVGPFLSSVEPRSPFYRRLRSLLHSASCARYGRMRILVNMDRCRWRMADYPQAHPKYVVVNIPAYRLWAVDGDQRLTMRVASGADKTKTPLLASVITRMDVNPQWVVPKSIVKKSFPHGMSAGYMKSRHFFVRERATGKLVPPGQCTPALLQSPDYLVVQEGGEGNSLGRIIFRFNNDFSIFLHDTSSRGVFGREDRGVSHGCVRVERPYALAHFLVGERKADVAEKIWYSMHADVSPLGKSDEELTDEERAVADTLNKRMLVGSVNVVPPIPLYIVYFTLYAPEGSTIYSYDDVYGYDAVIAKWLGNYL